MDLKDYQTSALSVLRRFLGRASEVGAEVAFGEQPERRTPYREIDGLRGPPYVCLRVPTGGGKTLMASHAIGIAAREYLHAERTVVLWLAPTSAIVDQTLRVLRDRDHPCRLALSTAFGGDVCVLSLSEALVVSRPTMDTDTVIVVSTLAALRVQDTLGRRVYETNGALHPHFAGLRPEQEALLERGADGVTPFSLANALRVRRPLVIMDEAHNARTPLSFETLARFAPSCLLEFTATPDRDRNISNVLVSVSAAELKAEHMIKLPIRLVATPEWRQAIALAVDKQAELERLSTEEGSETGEYVRPIVLIQAEADRLGEDTVSPSLIRSVLTESPEFHIPADQVVVHTGQQRELPDDVLSPNSPVRYVITKSALREGWDCPFAYVLCSVAALVASTAVEQILGRILRLPNARLKRRPALNCAYAYASSPRFADAAAALKDALVDRAGFERFEAERFVEAGTGRGVAQPLPLFAAEVRIPIEEQFASVAIRDVGVAGLRVEATGQRGEWALVYSGPPLTDAQESGLLALAQSDGARQAVRALARQSAGQPSHPAALGMRMEIPQLVVNSRGRADLFEEQFRDVEWSLADVDATVAPDEIQLEGVRALVYTVDVAPEGRVQVARFEEDLHRQLSLSDVRGPRSEAELAVWIDREIAHPDLPQAVVIPYIQRVIQGLQASHGARLEALVLARYRLRDVLRVRLDVARRSAAAAAFEGLLFRGIGGEVGVSPEHVFRFPNEDYPAPRWHEDEHVFQKHFHPRPSEMNGEEARCAALIDSLPETACWIRNLERKPLHAFWLPTPTDKFYPDFVVRLRSGSYLVVEYKGERDIGSADTREKRAIGEAWAARAGAGHQFLLVGIADYERSIRAASRG